MGKIDADIAELEATLRHLKKLRRAERPGPFSGKKHSSAVRAKMSAARKAAWADPAVRAKMSAASKAAWAEKYEAEIAPKRTRETRKGLPEVPRDPFEAMLFGGP